MKMKNIAFILFALFAINLKGQQAEIECVTAGENCFRPNPDGAIIHNGRVNNTSVVGNAWTIVSAVWTARPLTELVNTQTSTESDLTQPNVGSPSFITRWANRDNNINSTTSQKTIKLKLTVSRQEINSSGNEVTVTKDIEKTEVINVKFLGPITSASSPSLNNGASFTNGQTVGLPCTTQPFTVTVPTPANATGQVNDPATTIIYTWSLPNGWSGSSTSNTITISPPEAGNATIFVSAKRADGTKTQSFSFSLSRNSSEAGIPVISTSDDNVICVGNTQLYTASATNATSFSWSVTPSYGLSVTSPNNQSTNVTAVANGIYTLSLTANNACGVPKVATLDIGVGTPIVAQRYMNNQLGNGTYPIFQTFGQANVPAKVLLSPPFNIEAFKGFKWQWTSGTPGIFGYTYPQGGTVNGPTHGGVDYTESNEAILVTTLSTVSSSATWLVRAANACGVSPPVAFTVFRVGPSGYYRMASSNPAQNDVSVEIDEVLSTNALVSVKLVSHGQSQIVRTFAPNNNKERGNNKVDFEVSNLPRGTYYLLLEFNDGKKFKETIVLN